MTSFEIIDKKFNKKSSLSYDLSILIGMDSFFYLIEDKEQNVLVLNQKKISSSTDRKDELKNLLIADKLLQLPFEKTKLCFSSAYYTLIPEELKDKSITRTYLEQVSDLPSNHLAFNDEINSLALTNVYGVLDDDFHILNSYFPRAQHIHSMSALLLGCKEIASQNLEETLFINVAEREMAILLFRREKLRYSNFFKFSNASDFLYYVMLVYEQLGLDPEKNAIRLSGKIVKKSQIYDMLFKYIRHVHLTASPSYYALSKDFSEIQAHHFFDLFSLKLCES